ncbi:SAM-dependent methyltransferase [Actinoalloteichus sp. AHMU CJ021]|uniref:O-methyltransferase n=1 Tax=Actinoalloteichus TaxID=65496 RepID=UPI000410115A|nr:class I SAM-dependent methyltransferase [Actinoalloteichus caeruleus]AUS81174.1 SAM-dependent methyltransferase [Actinoalloteichus sp. AHMU CJ021]
MANQLEFTAELSDYVRTVSLREDQVLRELREETAQYPAGRAMQVLAEEGQFLAMLVGLCEARTVLEIGTFTGYSTLCMARALPAGGRVVTCDISDKWPAIGAEFWRRAGVLDRIDPRVGDAADTLTALLAELGPDSVDLAFIDADKTNYLTYYERTLPLVRPGGLIVVDNTLLSGQVIDAAATSPEVQAIREFNAFLRDDDRVELSMLMMADGITLARRKSTGVSAR